LTALLLVPAALSFLLLGAHFLRGGHPLPMVLTLALVGLLVVRRRWAAGTAQVALLLGALEWVRTTLVLVGERSSMGMPYGRMALILGAVATACALSAWPFRASRLRRWFGAPPPGEGIP
jgi:hypothetical protein